MDTKVKLELGEGGLVLSISEAEPEEDDLTPQQLKEQIKEPPVLFDWKG